MISRTFFQWFRGARASILIFACVCLLSLAFSAIAQEPITGSPTVISEAWYPGISMDASFVQDFAVLEFGPGSSTSVHSHGGPHIVTVLDGAVTVNEDGVDTVYEAGQSFLEAPGHEHHVFNVGDAPARVVATTLLQDGGEMTTVTAEDESGRPGPGVVYELAVPDLTMDGLFAQLLQVLEFEPDAGIPLHTVGGRQLVLVLEGALTVSEDGTETVYEAGQNFTAVPGRTYEVFNAGDAPVRVAATWLLPIAASTTPQQ